NIAMSVAYAIWTGAGTAGGVMIGVLFYKESKSFLKLFLIAVIITCTAGLKFLS
ncbi:QacE family quaternary ammonium compound efflux SMR transporter, partial [Campylobacter jejuni]|nr:QacE family quaternary ammonium compound efflux SMR transporter [Campylobacter jejuni]